ncbi:MAG: Hsp20 family protein [Rhodospirillales bacterium]|nr:Hsp20 family protein [Rhodospirillales bacterium]
MPAFNSPHLLGFDHIERLLDHVSKSSGEGYPPYNIEQIGDHGLRITLAVAGFGIDDLNVSLEDKQLVIRGRKQEDDGTRVFLHRGIAARQFQRSFVIAEGIEVIGASLDKGLLNVDLQRKIPQPEIKTIAIVNGAPGDSVAEEPGPSARRRTIDFATKR